MQDRRDELDALGITGHSTVEAVRVLLGYLLGSRLVDSEPGAEPLDEAGAVIREHREGRRVPVLLREAAEAGKEVAHPVAGEPRGGPTRQGRMGSALERAEDGAGRSTVDLIEAVQRGRRDRTVAIESEPLDQIGVPVL